MTDLRIGFDVPQWTHNRPIEEYTNEELLEYWYKLRFGSAFSRETGRVDVNSSSTAFLLCDMQEEMLKRMRGNK